VGTVSKRNAERFGWRSLFGMPLLDSVAAKVALATQAAGFADEAPGAAEHALAFLAEDPTPIVREQAARGLARLLRQLDGAARSELVMAWARGPGEAQRACIARALRAPLPVGGAAAALAALANDTYSEVRLAACEAAACRFEAEPEIYIEVLRGAAHDNHRSIRLAAIAGLQKAAELGHESAVEELVECADDDDAPCADRALDALAAAPIDPEQVLAGFEAIAAHPEDHDGEVLHQLVVDCVRFGRRYPEHARRVLQRLLGSREPWVRAEAETALQDLTSD
jgi:hypothetical protein